MYNDKKINQSIWNEHCCDKSGDEKIATHKIIYTKTKRKITPEITILVIHRTFFIYVSSPADTVHYTSSICLSQDALLTIFISFLFPPQLLSFLMRFPYTRCCLGFLNGLLIIPAHHMPGRAISYSTSLSSTHYLPFQLSFSAQRVTSSSVLRQCSAQSNHRATSS